MDMNGSQYTQKHGVLKVKILHDYNINFSQNFLAILAKWPIKMSIVWKENSQTISKEYIRRSQSWFHNAVIATTQRLRQEGHKFESNLGNTVNWRLSLLPSKTLSKWVGGSKENLSFGTKPAM